MLNSDVSKDDDPSNAGSVGDTSVTGDADLEKWIWVIEYLAKFRTELSMVHDVFQIVPELPDHLGDRTDEMVAFRCLTSLVDSSTPESSNGVVSDAKTKVEFDSSASCEHVLQCILDEIPMSELKPGAPGLSKWNLVPFIESKIRCLPKCTLELVQGFCDCLKVPFRGALEISAHVCELCCFDQMIESSSKKRSYTVVSPCHASETMRSDDKETDQITPRLADKDTMGRIEDGRSIGQDLDHGDGYEDDSEDDSEDVISKSHTSSRRINEAQESKGFSNESGKPVGHVSSPSERIYKCRKCQESGKLLFCSRGNCAVMLHAKCMDSPPAYDDAGNFYCPLCVYTSASSEYLQCQAELRKAKKKLALFLQLMSKVNKKKSIGGSRNGDPTTNL